MPETTSGETAKRIKTVIEKCDRFVLLATDAAIESKWCNWELGFGDAKKYIDRIALLPIKQKYTSDEDYKGNEYMQIYPHIVRYSLEYRGIFGSNVGSEYYVVYPDGSRVKLIDWLKK